MNNDISLEKQLNILSDLSFEIGNSKIYNPLQINQGTCDNTCDTCVCDCDCDSCYICRST